MLTYNWVKVFVFIAWVPAEIFVGGGQAQKRSPHGEKSPHKEKKVAKRPLYARKNSKMPSKKINKIFYKKIRPGPRAPGFSGSAAKLDPICRPRSPCISHLLRADRRAAARINGRERCTASSCAPL